MWSGCWRGAWRPASPRPRRRQGDTSAHTEPRARGQPGWTLRRGAGKALAVTSNANLRVIDGYLSPEACHELLEAIRAERAREEAPLIERPMQGRSLRYRVLDGERIYSHLPALVSLYERVLPLVSEFAGAQLTPLASRAIGLNVNITQRSGEYRWHYDRNAVTAILYLNRSLGGETEIYPGYRLHLGRWRASRAQQWLDRLLQVGLVQRQFGQLTRVAPEVGRLVLMRGDKCLHSVTPVESDSERINVIMSFDWPGATFPQARALDAYIYSTSEAPSFDPNYTRR